MGTGIEALPQALPGFAVSPTDARMCPLEIRFPLEAYSRSLRRTARMREEANDWTYLPPIGLRAGLAVS